MGKGRIPLAQHFMSRDGSLGVVDSFTENGCFNKDGDKIYVLKRPGTQDFQDFSVPGVSDPQGGAFYNDVLFGIYTDILYNTGGGGPVGTTGQTWTQSSPPSWYARSFFSATVFGSRVYVIGGEAAQLRADISYSADGITWAQNASSAPFGHRQGHQACSFNGLLWVIGGFQNDSTTTALMNDVWSSPDGVTWTQVTAAAQWAPRDNHTVVASNNGMYLYGGDLGSGTLSDECWFSTDGATWQLLNATATGTARGQR